MANFIKAALDKVLTYVTPEAVVKYMEMQSALGNPPWKKGEESKIYLLSLYYSFEGSGQHSKEF